MRTRSLHRRHGGAGWAHADPHDRRPLRCHRRPRPAQAAARAAAPVPVGPADRGAGRRHLAGRPRPRLLRRLRAEGDRGVRRRGARPEGLGGVRQAPALGPGRRRGPGAARDRRPRPRRSSTADRRRCAGCTTSACRPRPRCRSCTSSRTPAWSSAAGSSWRSRSAPTWPRPRSSTASCTRSSTRSRSSGSTTSSARRRPRTSWPSASPTACSSRSGTATTSTTSRSTCPRSSAWRSAPNFYESTGAYRDMVVTHLFQVLAFTAMEPPTALEPRAISEEKNKVFRSMLPIEPSDVVRGQYVGYRDIDGRRARLRDRDLHRAQVLRRQLALGRRPVLPAHRQAAGRGRPDHLDRLPRAAALDVPAGLRRRRQRARPPDLRPRRPVEDVAVLLRQAPRPGHAAGQALDAVRDARDRLGRRGARGLRAADLRRRPRRPHPVHLAPRASSGCGRSPPRCWTTRPSYAPTRRAPGVPTGSTS